MDTRRTAVRDSSEIAARKELKRQRRQEHLEVRLRAEAAQRRRQQLMWGGAAVATLLAFGALVFWLIRPEPGPPVQTVLSQGAIHIARGESHPAYNSTPPTSGWHYGDAVAPWGVSSAPIPNEVQVHNLEHGGIMVQYNCPDGCPETVGKIEQIVRSYPSKVILAPYPGMDHKIVLTAWTKLAYLDEVDEPFIRRFIAQNKNKAPERVPD
ncbi:MAG: DUF3105 domain-containing protein [Chloroflexi bacterium]|nr:DUF3105 domain-containing protein [Chloroflexota bacterium]